MHPIVYEGERLIPGIIGSAFVILAFAAALLATIAYSAETFKKDGSWLSIGRNAWFLHSVAVGGIVATLFYMLAGGLYEYHYVWQHSNSEMQMKYIFSCFWEGQEGSFLLWAFWHVILGLMVRASAGVWEPYVMSVFSSVQVFLSSMLLGIYFGDFNIGSSPFNVLLREHPDFANIPLFSNPAYLSQLDGRGLNPLLQNYWMTIHPPTLFLGFAATLVPFSYAIAGLWKRDYTGWMKPALPWTLFGTAILGLGILMGGAWAYEALSFGGFWAWDPVENASLVPWMTLVGAAHMMLIYKSRGTSLFLALFLSISSFVLVLYSTFLTRSGILGESSVHAFTDLGLAGQLLIYLLFYKLFGFILLVFRWKELPKNASEESVLSREFWMLIGALVLFFGAVIIGFSTSYPVINKVFGTQIAPPVNVIHHYHRSQIPIAIIVLLLSGFSVFLKYKTSDAKTFLKSILPPAGIALLLCIGILTFLRIENYYYPILLFAGVFSVLANIHYLIQVLKGKVAKAGSTIAHVGFALIMIGSLISMSQQQLISSNMTDVDIRQLGEQFTNHENTLLFKNDTVRMGDYYVSYRGRNRKGVDILYEVEYMVRHESGAYRSEFTLFPKVQTNPRMGNVSEPDTRHFVGKDIYTHVTYAELDEPTQDTAGYHEPVANKMAIGDTVFTSKSIIKLEGFGKAENNEALGLSDKDIAVSAELTISTLDGKKHTARPMYILKDMAYIYVVPDLLEDEGLELSFTKIFPQENKVEISYRERKSAAREFIIMKAVVFPGINVLWIGCVLMVFGILVSAFQRFKQQ